MMFRDKKDFIKQLKQAQSVIDGSQNPSSSYCVGQWNGLEYALSIAENREPKYKLEPSEQKREIGRTLKGRLL